MFSLLSRGYGSWDGKAKSELTSIETPESQDSFILEDSPFFLPPLTSNFASPPNNDVYYGLGSPVRIPFDRNKSYESPKSKVQQDKNETSLEFSAVTLPAILPSTSTLSSVPGKTFTTRSGALILYSENLALPSSRRRKRKIRKKKRATAEIKTTEDLRACVLNYRKNGGDPLFLDLMLQNRLFQTSAKRDVRPGYSPKRYIANLGRSLEASQWERLVESGSLKDPALKIFKPSSSGFHTDGTRCDLFPDRLVPYSTMSLPAVSPAHSVTGSMNFYQNGMSEGAASLFDENEEYEEEENNDAYQGDNDMHSSRPESPGEELIDRLPEVQSPWKLTYASLHPDQKREILSQLLVESALQRSSTEEWVTTVSEESGLEPDLPQTINTREIKQRLAKSNKQTNEMGWQIPGYEESALSPGVAKFPSLSSFERDRNKTPQSTKSSSLSSVPVLPPINAGNSSSKGAPSSIKGPPSHINMKTTDIADIDFELTDDNIAGKSAQDPVDLDDISVGLSKEDTKSSSDQWPADRTELSEHSLHQSKTLSIPEQSETVHGWDALTSGSEGGWPAPESGQQLDEVKTQKEEEEEHEQSDEKSNNLLVPDTESSSGLKSAKTSNDEDDGWPAVKEEIASVGKSDSSSVKGSTEEYNSVKEDLNIPSAGTDEKESSKDDHENEQVSISIEQVSTSIEQEGVVSNQTNSASDEQEVQLTADNDAVVGMDVDVEKDEEEPWEGEGVVERDGMERDDDEGFVEDGEDEEEGQSMQSGEDVNSAVPNESLESTGHLDESDKDERRSVQSQDSHVSLAELQNQAVAVAEKVLSRPQSGVIFKEDVEMAAKIWANALEEILGPSKPGARVSSATLVTRQTIDQLMTAVAHDVQDLSPAARRRKISRSAGPAFYAEREALRQAAYRRPSQKAKVGGVASGHTYYQPKPPDVKGTETDKGKGSEGGSTRGSGSPGPTQSIPADRVSNADIQMGVISYASPPEVTVEPATPGDIGDRPTETPIEDEDSEDDEDFAAALTEIVNKLNKPADPPPQRRRSSKREASSKTSVSSTSIKEEEEKKEKKEKVKEKRKRTKTEKQKTPFHAGKAKEEKPPTGLKDKKKRKSKEKSGKSKDEEEVETKDAKEEKVEEVHVDEETGEHESAKSIASASTTSDETYSDTASKTSDITSATSRATSERPPSLVPSLAPTEALTDTKAESEYSELSHETAQTDTTGKLLDPNSRALKRAQAAERRRQEVERKRRERDEAKRMAQEEAERAEQVRKEAEEEMQKREDERMRMRQEREEEQRRKDEAEKDKERQAKAKAEREKRIREEWKRKQAEILAQRKLEEELRLERERAALEVEEEVDKEEEERMKNMEEEERQALLEKRRLELEEKHKQEEIRKIRELELRKIEEERRLKIQQELELLEQRRKQRQAFILGLIREFGNLLLGQRTTRAFTFSYFDRIPWIMESLKNIKITQEKPKIIMETIQEEDEE